MQKTHKFEINALNVIKSFLIIVLSIIGGSNSNSSSSSNSSHSKDNNNKITSVSTFNASEQMLFSGNNSNSYNTNSNNNNFNTYNNINYNIEEQETEIKINIERCRSSRQQGYTNSNNNNSNNNISNTNYTPVTKINEIIKNVQSAICSTTVSSTVTITKPTTTLPITASPTRISQSSNKQTAASWSSVARKRIDNSNSNNNNNNSYGIINIRNSNGKKNKTDIVVGSKFFGDLHQVRLFNEKDVAHGKPQQLDLNLLKSCGRTARTTTINRRQRAKRFIIFDGSGVVKLIIGGSIPIKLISKQRSLTNIFNLQMQYTPPPIPLYWWSIYNTTTFAARNAAQKAPLLLANDGSRTFLYAVIEKLLESKGMPGTECLLKAICVVAQQPLEDGSVFHEILNAIFIPVATNIEMKYLDAQAAGRYGVDCAKTFAKCPRIISWLNGITFGTLF